MRGLWARRVISGAAIALLCGFGAGVARAEGAGAVVPHDPGPSDPIGHGEYMTRASDCMPCHTGPGQAAFSGGLSLLTPFGPMESPNITPDKKTGIGNWTADQFYRALHNGINEHGKYIYPVMSFTSYTKMTREDVDDIHAYLTSLKPVEAKRNPNQLAFPFNQRLSLLGWRIMFFSAGTYKDDPSQSAQWNRGAYLVQGAGHCGECHTPRNMLGAMQLGRSLSGGIVDNYYAPNISADPETGIGARTVPEIVQFLRTGEEHNLGVAYGPMAEVVHESMRYMTDDDLTSIAVYLKGADKRPDTSVKVAPKPKEVAVGEALYGQNCAQCHKPDGSGVPHAIPNLAGNAAVLASLPDSVVAPVLNGLPGGGGFGAMPSFAGALDNKQIADLANYVRTAWGNKGSANATPGIVAGLRSISRADDLASAGGSNAARALNCPKVGPSMVAGTMASDAAANLLAAGTPADMRSRVGAVIAQTRADNPTAGAGEILNTVMAAYCPVVAADPTLSKDDKRARLVEASQAIGQIIAEDMAPVGPSRAVLTTTVTAAQAQAIGAAAQGANMTPGQWMSQQAGRASAGAGQ